MYQQKAEYRGARGGEEGRCESCIKDHVLLARKEETRYIIETKGYQEVGTEEETEEANINGEEDCKESQMN